MLAAEEIFCQSVGVALASVGVPVLWGASEAGVVLSGWQALNTKMASKVANRRLKVGYCIGSSVVKQ